MPLGAALGGAPGEWLGDRLVCVVLGVVAATVLILNRRITDAAMLRRGSSLRQVTLHPSLEPRCNREGQVSGERLEVAQSEQGDRSGIEKGPHRAAHRVTAMDITIYQAMLPHDDPAATLAFYRDALGFEVGNDVEYQGMHWITVGPPNQSGTSTVLYPPAVTPGLTDEERKVIAEMMAKGTFASINLSTPDLDGVFERVEASDAEVVQEPTDQPYGVRDCAFRDPAGNMIRIMEMR